VRLFEEGATEGKSHKGEKRTVVVFKTCDSDHKDDDVDNQKKSALRAGAGSLRLHILYRQGRGR
jgi:hypothetical protein